MSGATSYHAGFVDEDQVASHYADLGHPLRHKRWRGKGGEIDLVLENGTGLIFVEVKRSRDFATAAARVSPQQIQRISASASEYLAKMPNGQDTDVRFDVALVNGSGQIEVLENAFGH